MNALASSQPSLAPDPALPQRDLLLDAEQMASRLSLLVHKGGAVAIGSCEKQRIKYRVGQSLRVLYRVGVNGDCHLIAARALPQGIKRRAVHAATPNQAAARPPSQPVYDGALNTLFWTYPNDRKIRSLDLLSEMPSALADAMGSRWTRSEVVAYAPEKCVTARCLAGNGQVAGYAKMYAGDAGQQIYQTYRQLAASGLPVAKALAYSDVYQLLLLEDVPGARIADLTGGDLFNGFGSLGKTLACLHNTPIPESLLPRFRRLDRDRLRHCARIISQARPDLARLVNTLADELYATSPEPTGPFVFLHGDVHPKNGIASEGRITLIDLDQAAAGPAAADVGSMLALLHYNWRVGYTRKARAQELGEAFVTSYGQSRQLPAANSIRWHTAAALLAERALRSVNRIRPEGLFHLEQLLADAREILRGEAVER